jgi:hypothetical protein
MRHHFCAPRPSIQHRSSGNSAAAAPAPTQLSATQHLPASKHDAATQSCCLVPQMLHASNIPPGQMRHHSGHNVRRYSIAQAAIQRPRHQHPRSSLRHSICLHLIMMPKCKAAAECLRCFMDPICPRNRCATIFAPPAHRYSIAQAAIQRPRHQHPRSSLRHSICLHPSTMPQRKAAA